MAESASVKFLYNTKSGRICLCLLKRKWISSVCGKFLDSPLSKCLIKGFVAKNNINLDEYSDEDYKSFNEFFTRQIKSGARPFSKDAADLISPCDGLLTVYSISNDTVLPVKQSKYTIESLLRNPELASQYQNGICLVFRLCVDNYHRYCYIDNGRKENNINISGFLHTVRPTALESLPVFVENAREYTLLHTENFGDVVQVEVGALLVGKIDNYHQEHTFSRGEEKGRFLFGGSTVMLILKDGAVSIDKSFRINSGIEFPVRMGQTIGKR